MIIQTKYGHVSTNDTRCCAELECWIKDKQQRERNRKRRSQKSKRKKRLKHGKAKRD
nr:MAG TPA: hypothetical protein [Caudoviricetes sp.]